MNEPEIAKQGLSSDEFGVNLEDFLSDHSGNLAINLDDLGTLDDFPLDVPCDGTVSDSITILDYPGIPDIANMTDAQSLDGTVELDPESVNFPEIDWSCAFDGLGNIESGLDKHDVFRQTNESSTYNIYPPDMNPILIPSQISQTQPAKAQDKSLPDQHVECDVVAPADAPDSTDLHATDALYGPTPASEGRELLLQQPIQLPTAKSSADPLFDVNVSQDAIGQDALTEFGLGTDLLDSNGWLDVINAPLDFNLDIPSGENLPLGGLEDQASNFDFFGGNGQRQLTDPHSLVQQVPPLNTGLAGGQMSYIHPGLYAWQMPFDDLTLGGQQVFSSDVWPMHGGSASIVQDQAPQALSDRTQDLNEVQQKSAASDQPSGKDRTKISSVKRVVRPSLDDDATTNKFGNRFEKVPIYKADGYQDTPAPFSDWVSKDGYAFRYHPEGELLKEAYNIAELRAFIFEHPVTEDHKLTLWIQHSPADSSRRYPRFNSSRCRFKACPMRREGYHGTIPVGHLRVAFDEKWKTYGPSADPFHVAGYVHLYCLERFLDLVQIARLPNVTVKGDCRANLLPNEPGGKFAAVLSKTDAAVCARFLKAAASDFATTKEFSKAFPGYPVGACFPPSGVGKSHDRFLNCAMQKARLREPGRRVHDKAMSSRISNTLGDLEVYLEHRGNKSKVAKMNIREAERGRKRKRVANEVGNLVAQEDGDNGGEDVESDEVVVPMKSIRKRARRAKEA